LSYKRRLRE